MKKYTIEKVKEKQLEDLIRRAPDLIEPGLRFIDNQIATDRGPLDILFVDNGNALVVSELKIVENDNMLFQGIDYYDFISKNLEAYARAYSNYDVDPRQSLRLMLIAPSFSSSLLKRVKWINLPISLVRYQCLKFEDSDEIIPVYTSIEAPSIPEQVSVYNIEDRYNWITDKKIRLIAKKAVSDIKDWDSERINVSPTKNDISIKASGTVISYLAPRRNNFLLYTYDDGDWKGFKVSNNEEKEVAMTYIRKYFDELPLK